LPSRQFKAQFTPPPVNRTTVERWRRIDRTALHEVNRTEFDRIMSKIETGGTQSLSEAERAFLDRFSAL
jgi:predicted ATPase